MTNIGHNTFGGGKLKSTVEKIERLEGEKQALSDDIRVFYAEAKANGFDPKIIRKVIALRKRDKHEIEAEQSMVDLYMHALTEGDTEMLE